LNNPAQRNKLLNSIPNILEGSPLTFLRLSKANKTELLTYGIEGDYAQNIEIVQLSNNYIMESRRFS
jgi:hypothetical protein